VSFSADLRTECVEVLRQTDIGLDALRSLVLFASGTVVGTRYLLETRHEDYASWLKTRLFESGWIERSETPPYRVEVTADYLLEAVLKCLRTDDERLLGDAFALLFAACGSMTNPQKAAHMEFRIKNQIVAAAFTQATKKLDIDLLMLSEPRAVRLYLKDSQSIGDMLIRMGTMRSFLTYSSLKVDKEVLNQVNRQVNCDRANARRVADASALQAEAILLIDREIGLSTLSDSLETAARARLMHPDMSLAELGMQVSPPVGKSGMNHRMKKLMQLAESLQEEI
jgi:DNA-binding transcriptional regulator WhiA